MQISPGTDAILEPQEGHVGKRMAPGKIQNNRSSCFHLRERLRWANAALPVQGAFAHFLINGQPSMTSEFLRTLHFSCTEPGLPEPVKLAQEPTGENSKAWIKAGGENHPAPV